ncbi:MAG: hypothetical protein ACYCYM_07485 [Saccharofermentanales bacterium]
MPRMGITAYDLLISCPGDVNKFIDIIRECVEGFNRMLGKVNNVEIVLKHWSTDSYPQSGDKPQELLNKQFVLNCDAAIAILWTNFGTPTDKYGSGTEEEIEEMLSSNKQVFMYFLDIPVNPSSVDMEQYKKVNEFKEKYKDRGIYVVVKDENELRQQFTNHLAMHFIPLVTGEKTVSEKRKLPILKIRDAGLDEYTKAIVRHWQFSECKLITEKAEGIFSKILALQKEYLPQRKSVKIEEKKTNSAIGENIKLQKPLVNAQFMFGTISDADIPEQWKIPIIEFANKNEIQIETQFWNVGNLKKKVSLLVSPLGGGGTNFEGNEDEKKRYDSIENLYWEIREYEEYKVFFALIDSKGFVNLVLTNIGNTFDEDIDVKLIIKKGCVLERKDIAVPDINIIEEILKMKFLDYAYEIENSDTICSYIGYPLQSSNFKYKIPDPFGRVSVHEEYKEHKQQYYNDLERIFCYEYFSKEDCDIFTFHINYLKHNTAMAFPSVFVLKEVPELIEYEISSKFVANIVKGEIETSSENC